LARTAEFVRHVALGGVEPVNPVKAEHDATVSINALAWPAAMADAEPPAAMTPQAHDKVSAPDTLPVAGIALDK